MFVVGPSVSLVLVHTLAIFSYLKIFIAYKHSKAQITGRNILEKPMTSIKERIEQEDSNSLLSVNNKSFQIFYPILSGWSSTFPVLLNEGIAKTESR